MLLVVVEVYLWLKRQQDMRSWLLSFPTDLNENRKVNVHFRDDILLCVGVLVSLTRRRRASHRSDELLALLIVSRVVGNDGFGEDFVVQPLS